MIAMLSILPATGGIAAFPILLAGAAAVAIGSRIRKRNKS